MSKYTNTDYATLAKRGFSVGLALFLVGVVGSVAGPAVFGPLPAWEKTLLVDMEALGILVGLFSVLGFGIVMPLVE
jgi:hypothetical protein